MKKQKNIGANIDVLSLKKCVEIMYRGISLQYHNFNHTKQVHDAGMKLAEHSKISSKDKILLSCAIYLHDIGNILGRDNHEEKSVLLSRELLPYFGATKKDIKIIEGLILATCMPQNPKTSLQKIICDADLSLCGHKDQFKIINNYRLELGLKEDSEWYKIQLKFLKKHKWFTKSAKELFDSQKQKNILKYESLLKKK